MKNKIVDDEKMENFLKEISPKEEIEVVEPKEDKKKPVVQATHVKTEKSPLKTMSLHDVATKIVVDDVKFIPQYQTEEAACADLIANIPEGSVSLPYRSTVVVDCGFNMEIKPGYKACIVVRSGLAKRGLIVANSPAQIDSDYRGRIMVIITNVGKEIIQVKHGDRFAQMYIEPVYRFDWDLANKLNETERGEGGLGSTGV